MNEREQIRHFAAELDKLVSRFAEEYDLPNASVIGALEMKIHAINRSAWEEEEE